MKISSFRLSENGNSEGIILGKRFNGELDNLKNVVILTGGNGSGKSRFLKLLQKKFEDVKYNSCNNDNGFKVTYMDKIFNKEVERELTIEMAKRINLINYSHFDAKLQEAEKFSPYVIHQSKNKLKTCNYEETAMNSLLYLKDLAEGYSEESNENNDYKALTDFIEFAKELELEFSWDKNKRILKIFGRKFEDANLSPGQLYALRVAVACKSHEIGENFVFLLDEPETHLHPSLLIKIINNLMRHFKDAQFFIATHSLPLISYLTVTREDTTVLYMEKGEVKDRLRSNSEPILNNLIGTEDEQFAIKQLFVSSEEMACNKFCMECFLRPTVVRGGMPGDSSVSMAENSMNSFDMEEPVTIVDYGAGEGRLLECMLEDDLRISYKYNAYNIEKDDAKYCEKLIADKGIKGKSYSDKEELSELNGTVDRIFMVNVLHEIQPESWKEEFNTISKLLKENGKLVIIEREILTMGEAPFVNGYLMLTGSENKSNAAEILFGKDNVRFIRHERKPYIIAYLIEKSGTINAEDACLNDVFLSLESDALEQISNLRKEKKDNFKHIDKYKYGLRLAFWLNQLACAIMCRKDFETR